MRRTQPHIYYDDNGGHGHSHVPCSPLSYCSRYHWRSPQPRLRAAAMRYGHVLVTNCRCRCCRRRALSLFHSPQQASYPAFWGHIWALGLVWVGRHCDRRTPAIRTITGSEFESVSGLFQVHSRCVWHVFEVRLDYVSRLFQGCLRCVLRAFEMCLKRVSHALERRLQGV